MGKKCCVPGCTSGYVTVATKAAKAAVAKAADTTDTDAVATTSGTPMATPIPAKISMHYFPRDDELKVQWIRRIPRDD